MKIKVNYILTIMLCVLVSGFVRAAAPSWSVNPAAYDYNMNMTVKLSVSCEALANPANMIGAFVNGVCRGVEFTSDVNGDDYLAGLTIFSNTIAGESVVFKAYNFDNDSIIDMVTTINFQDGAVFGYPSVPFVIYANFPPSDIAISGDVIEENSVDAFVGALSATDYNSSELTFSLVTGTGDDDNLSFLFSGDDVFNQGTVDFETKSTYAIRVQARDALGCSAQLAISIAVLNKNEAPQLAESTFYLAENLSSTASIGVIEATDVDDGDEITLTILGENNAYFKIGNNNELESLISFDYELRNHYEIVVVATDNGALSATSTIQVHITDVFEDENDFATIAVLSPNGDGKNDYFLIKNVTIYGNYSLNIYNAAGTIVYTVGSSYDNSWNGIYEGLPLENGTYYYLLQNNEEATTYFKGSFTSVK
jgi:gliding motility-associated-like protein